MVYKNIAKAIRGFVAIWMLLLFVFFGSETTIFAKSVKADISGNQVKVGEQLQISSRTKRVKFKSSNTKIASVSQNGVLTGKKAGTVKIKVKRNGYKEKQFIVTVKKKSKKPELPVAYDEVSLQDVTISEKNGKLKYEAVVKNNAVFGKIKKIEFYYDIQEKIEQQVSQEDKQVTESTDIKEKTTENTVVEQKNYTYQKKTVVLTAKNIKAGKTSKKVSCQADSSGLVSNMKLKKVKLYTGKALYEYDVVKQKGKLKWGVPDKTPPVFYGKLGKDSYFGDEAYMVCYSDWKDTYNFKKGIKAVDDRDGKVKISVNTSKINWKQAGIYKVKFTARDKAGNKASAWKKVKVYPKDTPEEAADDVLSLIIKPDWSDVKKAKAIYAYVTKHMSYVINNVSYRDWRWEGLNAIQYGTGDCYTYMAISQLLLNRAGIPCMTVKYESESNHHFWSLAYVQEGWYHFDATPRRNKKTFCLLTDGQARANGEYPLISGKYPSRATNGIH